MITVQIEESDALEMLEDRVEFWTKDHDVIDLFDQMYTNYLENGLFDGCNFDVMAIVDNDYINYCSVIDDSDSNFEKIMELALEGERDISCEDLGYSYIEAFNEEKGLILVRY
jgi:hypothetical protein